MQHSLEHLLQCADKTSREGEPVNRGRRIVWRISLPRLQVHHLEFRYIPWRAYDVQSLIPSLAPIVGIFYSDDSSSRVLNIENLYPVVIPE